MAILQPGRWGEAEIDTEYIYIVITCVFNIVEMMKQLRTALFLNLYEIRNCISALNLYLIFYNISESWEKYFYKSIHVYLLNLIKMRKCLYSSLYSTTETVGNHYFPKHIHAYLRHMGLVSEHCNIVSIKSYMIFLLWESFSICKKMQQKQSTICLCVYIHAQLWLNKM